MLSDFFLCATVHQDQFVVVWLNFFARLGNERNQIINTDSGQTRMSFQIIEWPQFSLAN